ncbi:MAG: PilZ domain-containing protein [bacterium]
MGIKEPKTDNLDINVETKNIIKIKKNELIEQIINDILISKNELGITLFPYDQFFKSYLIEIKPKYLVIDSLMPFYGNKLVHKAEYLKIHIESSKNNIDKYFLTKYKDEMVSGEDYNFLIYKPVEIILIDKRNVLRVLTNISHMAYIYSSYEKTDFVYPLHDLSWSGISFNSDKSMEPNSELKKTLIKFSNKTIRLDLIVVHSTYMYGKYRIGCKISEISDNDRDSLINFILEIERQNINSNLQ